MFKFLVVGVLLWHELTLGVSGQGRYTTPRDGTNNVVTPVIPEGETTTVVPAIPGFEIGKPSDPNGRFSFHAEHQSFYVNGPLIIERPAEKEKINTTEKEIRSDYKVTKGIGAHKVHSRKVTWNRARRTCQEEGGHLAIIRSDAEEKVIQKMMHEQQVATGWIGFHDQFEEGDWISVLDEPLAGIGWDAWAKLGHANPDNSGGRENCAEYRRDSSGINDAWCGGEFPFVCKISV